MKYQKVKYQRLNNNIFMIKNRSVIIIFLYKLSYLGELYGTLASKEINLSLSKPEFGCYWAHLPQILSTYLAI